jgi:GNAT superfamily N-acetyltransferase
LLSFILASPDHDVLVFDDGEVIAWVGLTVSHSLTSEPHASLMGLVVDAGHRSRGIGQAMMEAAEQWARDRGLGHLRLRTNLVRADAHRFYERIGYKPVKEQRVYEKRL